jgi:prolipoprotein diacylglyceryltransferase
MTTLAYITINIDPVIGHVGPFIVRWYGFFMALATLTGLLIVARRLARRGLDY